MKRSKFSLSNHKLLTMDMGLLIPCGLLEVLPGDTIQQNTNALVRCSPMLAPVMHPVDVRIHHWYVPYRLIWESWEDFITGGPDGMNTSVFPTTTFSSGIAIGTLADYLGLPHHATASITASVLPFRAYNLIWNEWYRDQDLQAAQPIEVDDGPDNATNRTLLSINWEKDYFTSSRPWEQKGPAITVPIGDLAPVVGIGVDPVTASASTGKTVNETLDDSVGYSRFWQNTSPANTVYFRGHATNPNKPNIYADLANASAVTVTALREAMALQRFEEARARYGSRYTEYLRYLGVRSSDARLQRPEFLGGGRQTIQFSEVLQTGPNTADDDTNIVGNMHGHGIAAMRSNRYRRFIEEHGVILSLMSVKPKTMYMDGIPRMWNRRVKEDFWQRELQHIGQQEVLNKEVYAAHTTPDGVFGYQDRYDEYRRQESMISGEFRTILNHWHFGRSFGSDPALNNDFVRCVPSEEPFAINSTHTLWCMVKHSIQARRLVASSGTSFIF